MPRLRISAVLLVLAAGCAGGGPARPSPIVLMVGATANGGFGSMATGRGTADTAGGDPLVKAFESSSPVLLQITARGEIDLRGDGAVRAGPDGLSITRGDARGGAGAYTPLEERVVDGGGTLPPVAPNTGALIGAFVTASTVSRSGFRPTDEDLGEPAVPSSALFLIGAGPTRVPLSGPGTLFLGVNDPRAANNAGAFEVTIRIIEPAPG